MVTTQCENFVIIKSYSCDGSIFSAYTILSNFRRSLKSVLVCGEACNCSEDSTTRIPLLWNHHDWNNRDFRVKEIAGMDGGCLFCEDFRVPELPQVDIRLYMAGEVCG